MTADLLTALQTRDAVNAGWVSAVDVCRTSLSAIECLDSTLRAFITPTPEVAQAQAEAVDARIRDGAQLPLAGVPVALKDNLCTAGVRTTAGSRILGDFVPPYDATVVTRLIAAGAVAVGKTNCDEFAMGSSTEHSAFGPTRNPWALGRAPGGSSGGSAVAVAAGMAPISLGSDTGGSIRQPAAFCGVVGLKPTYGRVSRYGLIAFASSLDQIGPFARTVDDVAAVLEVIAGADSADATCSTSPAPSFGRREHGVAGLRIGVPRRLLEQGVDEEVLLAFERSLGTWSNRGASLVDIELPHAHYGIPVYYLVATAECSANLARYDGVKYGFRAEADGLAAMYERTRSAGFGAEVKRRIMLGTFALSAGYYDAYYQKAQQARTLIRRDYDTAFSAVDVIALPPTPSAAFRLGERLDDPLQMYLADVFTVGPSLAGLPAISVPCGLTAARLPIGVQIVGRAFGEATVLEAARAVEEPMTPPTLRPDGVQP